MSIVVDSFTSYGVGGHEYAEVDVFKFVMKQSGMCMASLGTDQRVIEANDEFLRQFGQSAENVRGRSFFDLLHPGVHAPMWRHFERLATGRRARFTEHVAGIGRRDTVFAGEVTGIAIHNESGELVMTVVVVTADTNTPDDTVVMDRGFCLTDLDARILEGIAKGESTVRIASKLFLSRQGVEYHVGIMLRKMKVPNRAALVSKAFSLGLLSVVSWPPKVLPAHVK